MRKINYIVQPNNREEFYNYMHNYNYKDLYYIKEYMLNSHFPFGIDTKHKKLLLIESITVCACAAQNNQILSFEEFKRIIEQKEQNYVKIK